jgi:hypothetical protein
VNAQRRRSDILSILHSRAECTAVLWAQPKHPCHAGSEFLQPSAAMVHQITLFKLKPEITPQKLEQMMMTTRMSLLKIPEILSVKCGKSIGKNEWPFFVSLEFESMEKLAMTEDDAIYMKFVADVIKANTAERLTLNYEMEPGKNSKFS